MDSGCYWMKHRIPKALVNSMPENATIFSLLNSRRILVNFSVLQEINIHKWLHGGVMILGFPSQRETAQNYSSLAKITKNLHVVKPNGFSVFILFLSCTQQSWTLPPENTLFFWLLRHPSVLTCLLPIGHLSSVLLVGTFSLSLL